MSSTLWGGRISRHAGRKFWQQLSGLKRGFGPNFSSLHASPAPSLASRPARARPPNAPFPRAATSAMSGAVRTSPSPAERSDADKRDSWHRAREHAGAYMWGWGIRGGLIFLEKRYVHRGTQGYTGVHRGTQGYTVVQGGMHTQGCSEAHRQNPL